MAMAQVSTIQNTTSTGSASMASKIAWVFAASAPIKAPEPSWARSEHPASHGGVEHHEQIAARPADPLVLVPVGAGRLQLVEGPGDGALRAAAHRELHDQDGKSQHHEEQQVHDEEGRAAVLAGDVGEAPDVAEADGAAGRDEDEAEAAGEVLAGRGGPK